MLNAAIQNDSNMTVLAKKMIVVVAKSRLGEVRIKKPTKPNSFHTSGSPRADPYPNFDTYIYIHIYHSFVRVSPFNNFNCMCNK